ncbi:VIT1/CCC1 transporter family protein [Candidatus Pacearchaeota archaeon]|nr:VIT1/CCC1 transporter family protein [Candidatus Pacearchaeota archaeon]
MNKKSSMKKDKSNYNGAVVLGLNDALVEISGALVGLSFAFADTKLISTVGSITGFAAALSMAASEYLSAKEDNRKNPLKASIYTGITYMLAVLILVTPYFIFTNVYTATGVMFASIIGMIALYTGYASSINHTSFKSKFMEMFTITLVVSVISFLFGMLVKKLTS